MPMSLHFSFTFVMFIHIQTYKKCSFIRRVLSKMNFLGHLSQFQFDKSLKDYTRGNRYVTSYL